MRWIVLHGAAVDAMSRHLTMQGKPIPARFVPPEVMPGASQWLADFFDLSTDRQLTQYGHGPIPSASIARHTEGWPDSDADAFRACIRAMDAAYSDALDCREKEGGLPQPKGDDDAV